MADFASKSRKRKAPESPEDYRPDEPSSDSQPATSMPESMTAAVASPPSSTNTGPVQAQEGKDTFYAWEYFS
jgi:hypothetical protein